MALTREALIASGLTESQLAAVFAASMQAGDKCWPSIRHVLCQVKAPFATHLYCYQQCFPNRETIPAPAWWPDATRIAKSHLHRALRELHFKDYESFFKWSVTDRDQFWSMTTSRLKINLRKPLNIAAACLKSRGENTAIISSNKDGHIERMTFAELETLVNRIANSLQTLGLTPGTRIAIDLPMTPTACAIYLAIIKAGMVVVAIADSFVADEIAARIRITDPQLIFTQDTQLRREKELPLYEKVCAANAPRAIVIHDSSADRMPLRANDLWFDDFLVEDAIFAPVLMPPNAHTTILFSSGTTGDPKAIPWVQETAIKAAGDAYWHLDVHAKQVLCWPTNLGWMMGPWLIYAAFLNRAAIALYHDTADSRAFGEFVQKAKVDILGVVPTLVKGWRTSRCMEGLNWRRIKAFSSSAESSNSDDMLYLMWLGQYKPIIEYCGGTEIGGAYITSTVIQPNVPAAFSTPTLGLDFVLLDDNLLPANEGEVAIIPPSLGLSTELLNRDHDAAYFKDMPIIEGVQLRRHGDHIQRFGDYYRALGRTDDTMNLGGIKTSSIAIERVLNGLESVVETAAIAIPPDGGGPSQLIIYAVSSEQNTAELRKKFQSALNMHLNPLFRISDVVIIDKLPRTASNKIMRRELRKDYLQLRTS